MPATGRPVGSDSQKARCSTFFSTRSAKRFKHAARWMPVELAQGPLRKACLPAATALSTSCFPARGRSSTMMESSVGLTRDARLVLLSTGSTYWGGSISGSTSFLQGKASGASGVWSHLVVDEQLAGGKAIHCWGEQCKSGMKLGNFSNCYLKIRVIDLS